MSGLTVGLLSIDMLDLEIKIAIGTQAEMKQVSMYLFNSFKKGKKYKINFKKPSLAISNIAGC